MSDFGAAFNFLLAREGGYVNDLADPGGETKYGISKRAHPDLDIKNLTVQQAADVYQRDYWTPAGCDQLDQPAALAVFDTAVNVGVQRARAMWGMVNGDVNAFLWGRLQYYDDLTILKPQMQKFLPGWLKRVLLLRDATLNGVR